MEFIVLLEIEVRGVPCGSTEDLIEADSPGQAEEKAIAAWGRSVPSAPTRRCSP